MTLCRDPFFRQADPGFAVVVRITSLVDESGRSQPLDQGRHRSCLERQPGSNHPDGLRFSGFEKNDEDQVLRMGQTQRREQFSIELHDESAGCGEGQTKLGVDRQFPR